MSSIGTSVKSALQNLILRARSGQTSASLHIEPLGSFSATIGAMGLTSDKREGDHKTPIGSFLLSSAFGLLPEPPTNMPYRQITSSTLCIDDPASCHYNTIIDANAVSADWSSCERMATFDPQYRYGIVIESPYGSCLFIHVWKTPVTPTAGCIALSEENLLRILAWLDPAQKPTLTVCFEN